MFLSKTFFFKNVFLFYKTLKKAAKQFYVEEEAIYEAVAALTRKVPQRIQVFYKNGALHIAAD